MSLDPVVIIGAGPYGLSLAAHFASQGVRHRIFGRPMQFWSHIAKAGGERYLKSFCFGTSLSTPAQGCTFADYNSPRGLETFEPCSIENFANYGRWFQENQVPWAEPQNVAGVEPDRGGFRVALEDGTSLTASRVVVATGLSKYATVPQPLARLPSTHLTHTSRVDDFGIFKGRSVGVIGSGQSALEAAALLHEAGAKPQLIARREHVGWQRPVQRRRSQLQAIRSPITGLGTGPTAWAMVNFPGLTHRMPDKLRVEFVKRHLPPEGAWWLRSRVENKVTIHSGYAVAEAQPSPGGVELRIRRLRDGVEKRLEFEHIVAGTGFRAELQRLDFLAADIRSRVAQLEGAPRLSASFESSLRGLYFVGPASAMSFGPMFRFVVGAEYTSRTIAKSMA